MTNNFSKPAIAQSKVPWKTLVFSGIVFALSLVVYAALAFGYKTLLSASIERIEKEISILDESVAQEKNQFEERDLTEEFIQFYSQFANIRNLLESHTIISPFFEIFEKNTLTEVGFTDMRISVDERMINLSGFARSYEVLANQLAIYEKVPGVERVSLTSARMADRFVGFELRIDLSEDFFKASYRLKQPIEQLPEDDLENYNNDNFNN